jgi:zinc transport system permease protein
LIGALGIDELRRRMGSTSGDTALALLFYTGLAAGFALLQIAGSLNASVFSYLFGSILIIEPQELLAIVGLGASIVITIGFIRRALFAVVADDEWSRVAGLPVSALDRLLVVLTAVTVVAAMRVVGLLLVAALMVLPVAAVQHRARSFRGAVQGSVAVGVGAVVVGLALARWLALPPGAAIVLCCAAAVLLSLLGRRRFFANAKNQR